MLVWHHRLFQPIRPTMSDISFAEIEEVTGGRIGTFDAPCPLCGPDRRAPANRRRPVLRVWRIDPHCATYYCARCGVSGYATDGSPSGTLRTTMTRVRAETLTRDRDTAAQRLWLARYLWRRARPARETVVETYLRSRGIQIAPPATVQFLPPRKPGQHPAMIVAFGIPDEPAPGVLRITEPAITAVHLTLLK